MCCGEIDTRSGDGRTAITKLSLADISMDVQFAPWPRSPGKCRTGMSIFLPPSFFLQLRRLLEAVLAVLEPHTKPDHLHLDMTRITRRRQPVPSRLGFLFRERNPMNFAVPNDEIISIPIQTANSGGTVEPAPNGDTFSATSSDPASLSAAIDATSGSAQLVLTPLVQNASNLTVTVNDTAGLAAASLVVDIVADVTPTQIILNTAAATHTGQPVPAA